MGAQVLVLFLAASAVSAGSAVAQQTRVRAVLFYSPTCPHCQQVIEGTILPMVEQHGEQLEILAINTVVPDGYELYRSAMQHFEVPQERWGVPTLIIAETVLFGSIEIPERFPAMVEAGLEQGGIDWPAIPGLDSMLTESAADAQPPAGEESAAGPVQPEAAGAPDRGDSEPVPLEPAPGSSDKLAPLLDPVTGEATLAATVNDRLQLDPWGNGLSIVVLIGMLASLPAIAIRSLQRSSTASRRSAGWLVPALAGLGLLIAAYMAFVETSGTEAVCGPVGDCNTVQQSEHAVLFGVLPVGVLGVAGYLAILAGWLVTRLRMGDLSDLARLGLLGMTGFGVIFSIYLTFLEPFVIGASCAWCLSSAIIITVLLWLTAGPGVAALRQLTGDERS